VQSFDKLQKNMSEQTQLINQLMQERQLLKQQTQLLQQQGREQADKLRRTQLQKQRLETLCRSLQVGFDGLERSPQSIRSAERQSAYLLLCYL
jgi:hypothetical protein